MDQIWSPLEGYSWEALTRDVVAPLLQKQLDYVCGNSPFYRKKFGKGVRGSSYTLSDLRELPFTRGRTRLSAAM
jgi:phenylacetate-coenzyme A ligase PaaK-like adenylate-forming protein